MYSGGQERSNRTLHQELVNLTGKRKGVSFTYVPYCHEGSELYYNRAVQRYRSFGVRKFNFLDIDTPKGPNSDSLKKAFQSDIIYLSGGNTFYFLKNIKRSGLLKPLRKYVAEGGVIAGLSAGAHIMTPHIQLAGLKGTDPDKNEVGLKSFSALNLVPFEFIPHFNPSTQGIKAVKKYSNSSKNPIYASADGGGIVIRDDRFTVYGKAWIFYEGEMLRLT
ncbi:unnamed protein product [Sphagnum jensenii]|uniref:Peptidase S51 n=1 Tax=Sphagnum jensenii TaxID=128206 RepID=A0ABP0V8B8_9BRYO